MPGPLNRQDQMAHYLRWSKAPYVSYDLCLMQRLMLGRRLYNVSANVEVPIGSSTNYFTFSVATNYPAWTHMLSVRVGPLDAGKVGGDRSFVKVTSGFSTKASGTLLPIMGKHYSAPSSALKVYHATASYGTIYPLNVFRHNSTQEPLLLNIIDQQYGGLTFPANAKVQMAVYVEHSYWNPVNLEMLCIYSEHYCTDGVVWNDQYDPRRPY